MRDKPLWLSMPFIAVVLGVWPAPGPRGQTGQPGAPRRMESPAVQGLTGTASCSARACHGRLLPNTGERIEQNEYTIWQSKDKHARAFEVLRGLQSIEIIKNLGGKLA